MYTINDKINDKSFINEDIKCTQIVHSSGLIEKNYSNKFLFSLIPSRKLKQQN